MSAEQRLQPTRARLLSNPVEFSSMTLSTDVLRPAAGQAALALQCLTGSDALALVEPLFREYLWWIVERLGREYGVPLDDVDKRLEQHHHAFAAEMPILMGQRGRLLLARLDDTPVGVGALKPVDDHLAEVKRMYVRALARGRGVGRRLLQRLLADARAEGYRVVRLETLGFMTEARALYHSLGFVETDAFAGSESARAGLVGVTHYLALSL